MVKIENTSNPEIIAEIGVNYYDIAIIYGIKPLEAAKQLILEAKNAGANVVKFQTYKAEKLAAIDSPAYWDTSEEPITSQRELFSKFDKLSYQDYYYLYEYCVQVGIEFMSTPFDLDSAREIDPLVKRHKIASADITNIELISSIASFGKPVLLSTGASTLAEIEKAVVLLQRTGVRDITLLHCVLCYPTPLEKANLWKIQELKKAFPTCKIGYSDHTKFSVDVLVASYLLGATIIEKHFTLNKTIKGNDHYHAADPEDIKETIAKLDCMKVILGQSYNSWYHPSEELARKYARRGVYLVKNVKKGDVVRLEDVDYLRPQIDGIEPSEWYDFVEKEARYGADYYCSHRIDKSDITCV